jgi:hypothetical protein
MPRRRSRRQAAPLTARKLPKVQPFSLILQAVELHPLRKIAGKEGISIGAIIRRAIHTVIGHVHPDLGRKLLESETDAFLDSYAMRFPAGRITPAQRKAFKRRVAGALG